LLGAPVKYKQIDGMRDKTATDYGMKLRIKEIGKYLQVANTY
jgi:hypothetical protein